MASDKRRSKASDRFIQRLRALGRRSVQSQEQVALANRHGISAMVRYQKATAGKRGRR